MRTLTVMFRSKFFCDIQKLFNTDIMVGAPFGDRPAFLTIASLSKIGYINEVTGVFRRFHDLSATRSANLTSKFEFRKNMCKINIALVNYLGIKDDGYISRKKRQLSKTEKSLSLLKTPILKHLFRLKYEIARIKNNLDYY